MVLGQILTRLLQLSPHTTSYLPTDTHPAKLSKVRKLSEAKPVESEEEADVKVSFKKDIIPRRRHVSRVVEEKVVFTARDHPSKQNCFPTKEMQRTPQRASKSRPNGRGSAKFARLLFHDAAFVPDQ